jgi:hypothetical protein
MFLREHENVRMVSLEERFGALAAHERTTTCVATVVEETLAMRS